MGLTVHTPEQYEAALRKLFPRGPYWDRQFADPQSDCSLFCRAKLDALIRFRSRMSDLQNESAIQSAAETIDDWERVITGTINTGLPAEQRRALLIASSAGNVSVAAIKELALMYGITITDIQFPFRSAFFGFSRFGVDRVTSPAAFSVVFIYAVRSDGDTQPEFERIITGRLLANYIVYFIYGGA
jgi:uncharacterized protein YmfQ (DUF2313 family)